MLSSSGPGGGDGPALKGNLTGAAAEEYFRGGERLPLGAEANVGGGE